MTGVFPREALLVISLSLLALPMASQEPDLVILRSGNPVVGEVKSLRRGSLSFDTDEMDVVSIDWDDIAFLTSGQFFEVELVSGAEFFGSLASADTAQLVVVGATTSDTIPFPEVVSIQPFDTGFFARTNGFVDVGTNITQANSLRSILIKGQFNYRGPQWGFNVAADFYRQRQESVSETGDTTVQRTNRSSAQLTGSKFIGAKWAANAAAQAEQNEELDLDSRFLGVLAGRFQFVRNQGVELYAGAGASVNDEQFTGEERSTMLEILLFGGLDLFDVGDIDLYTSVSSFTNPLQEAITHQYRRAHCLGDLQRFHGGPHGHRALGQPTPVGYRTESRLQYSFTLGWSWS